MQYVAMAKCPLGQRNCLLSTPWIRILPEELPLAQLVKKFPAFYATRKFITVFTIARHGKM
jgi:hypothetical protein